MLSFSEINNHTNLLYALDSDQIINELKEAHFIVNQVDFWLHREPLIFKQKSYT
jgi:hypothetical protein